MQRNQKERTATHPSNPLTSRLWSDSLGRERCLEDRRAPLPMDDSPLRRGERAGFGWRWVPLGSVGGFQVDSLRTP